MIQKKLVIGNIPAVLYGADSNKLYIYVHGRYAKKEEAEDFAEIVEKHGYQVLSFDLPKHGERKADQYPFTVQNGVNDLKDIYSFVKDKYKNFSLYACSIGAYLSLLVYNNINFEKCLFVSPVLDMERLIQNMMKWSNTSEAELREKREIETSFGETLSWDYYEYVRSNPIKNWEQKTYILYGENDNTTEKVVLESFSAINNCYVDILANGEHYFHTKEQVDYMKNWIQKVVE